MRTKVSTAFLVLLIAVMFGVIFSVQTNSRNSILIKEMFYVAGGSLAAVMAAVFIFLGKPYYADRFSRITLVSVVAVLLLMVVMHFAGARSPNGPFTFLMLLSLTVLTVSSLLFIDEVHIRVFTLIMLASSAVMFVYALLQWQGINVFTWDAALTRSGRSTGSMGNPNLLGGFASAVVPLGAAYIFSLKNKTGVLKIILALIFTALATTAIVASGTRGSVIGVAAGTVVLLVWFVKNKSKSFKKLIPASVLVLVVIAAVAVPMSSRLSELDPSAEGQGTLQVRKTIWSGAISLFLESPVTGHGPGSFQILFPRYRNPYYSILGVSHNTLHAHCEYLEILVDLGIVGLILWAAAVWGMLGYLKKVSLFRAGAFAGMTAMLAEALVSVHLRWPPTAWLFATLAMVYLSRETMSVIPGKKMKAGAVLLIAASTVLAGGFFAHYVPLSRSSVLVFKGKDIFLARTENAMNAGYSAAAQWADTGSEDACDAAVIQWQNASVFADSAVAYSKQATEIYPFDLGGWYALGSAHLTRYMVMMPPVPAMRSALEQAGLTNSLTPGQIRNELLLGMAAYDSLVTMAPDYAEVHNNLALGYSNMGLLDQSMDELYKSYMIHAHRRNDYFNQVSALIAIHPNSVSGVLLYFHHILLCFDCDAEGHRLEGNYNSIVENAWCIVSSQPENTDTLVDCMCELSDEVLPMEQAELLSERIRHIDEYSPFASWDNGTVLAMADEDASSEFLRMAVFASFCSSSFPSVLPCSSDFYTLPSKILFDSQWNTDIFSKVMDIYFRQIVIDRHLDDVYSLLNSDRFASRIDSDAAQGIISVRSAVGGSRTAMREGFQAPWLPNSLPALISDSLHFRMAADSLNPQWYEMELEMTFLLVTSYWWDYNIFASEQNQYLLDRIFYCRNKIRELKPEVWSAVVAGILTDDTDRIRTQTQGASLPSVDMLRDDLVSGAVRVPVSP
jgi:O-antigen ligase